MTQILVIAVTAFASLALLCLTALRAWRGWLDLKRLELAQRLEAESPDIGLRIDLAAVKERLRKLEAIADGVNL